MMPDYRHASPPPIPDGDTVIQPPAEMPPPTSLAERWPILVCLAVTALAIIVGVLTR